MKNSGAYRKGPRSNRPIHVVMLDSRKHRIRLCQEILGEKLDKRLKATKLVSSHSIAAHREKWTNKNEEHTGSVAPPTKDKIELATCVPFAVVFLKSNMLTSNDPSAAPSARTFCWLGLMYI